MLAGDARWAWFCGYPEMLKLFLSIVFVAALVACQATPRSTAESATARLAARAVEMLKGCQAIARPASFDSADSVADAGRTPLAVNEVVTARLHDLSAVKFARDPEKRPRGSSHLGGMIAFTAPAPGTYVLGSASVAWIDLVDANQNRSVAQRSYEWVESCGRRMKAGVFELQANARYLIQISASPDATVELFMAGPLN